MLDGFMNDIGEYKQNLKFKISGKILDSSAWMLKRKSNTVINYSLEAQEDIKQAKIIEPVEDILLEEDEGDFDDYDDEDELYDAFCELDAQNLLDNEQWAAFQEEKVSRVLDLELPELNKRLKDKKDAFINLRPKVIYRKLDINDLSHALNDVLSKKNIEKQAKTHCPIKLEDLPFLPENFIANAEEKRASFENRIEIFHNALVDRYNNKPISFLSMVPQPTAKALVDTVLIILHLINLKKIEIWKSFIEEGQGVKELEVKNNGQNIYLSPLL